MSLTLEEYARVKQLDIEFLREVGLTEHTRQDGTVYVRFPYRDTDGIDVTARYRDRWAGPNRFRWKSGAKSQLYGYDRLSDAREAGFILIVEGESDCHTLWQAGIPALGMPGTNMWREERDVPLLEGIAKIYLVDEGDGGGATIMKNFAGSAILPRAQVVSFGEHKDPSSLYLADPATFKTKLHEALALAQPYRAVEQKANSEDSEAAFRQCRALAQSPDILAALCESFERIGVVGEDRNAKLLYLALTSRLLQKPVSMAAKGPSATGKSYVVDRVLDHFPAAAYHKITAMSERGLPYNEEDFRHRFIVFAEATGAQGEMQSLLLRSLLSEGRIDYDSVGEGDNGKLKGVRLTKEGPTGLIFTTTRLRVHEENETRLLSLSSNDTAAQTKAIMESIATRPEQPPIGPEWAALQTWLAGAATRVVTPFLLAVAKLTPASSTRMRRDFMSVKSLIEAHALLHQATRETDEHGNIVATLRDYTVVRDLVSDLIAEGQAVTVKTTVRETVEAVRALNTDGHGMSVTAIAAHMSLDIAAISRRCAEALRLGYLANNETMRGRKARFVPGDRMPEDGHVLPSVQQITRFMEGGVVEPPPDFDVNSSKVVYLRTFDAFDTFDDGGPDRSPPCEEAIARDRFEERAAVLEFDEGLSREEAEAWAMANLGGGKTG